MEIAQIKFRKQFLIQQHQQWAGTRVEEKSYNDITSNNKALSHFTVHHKEMVAFKKQQQPQRLLILVDDLRGCHHASEER